MSVMYVRIVWKNTSDGCARFGSVRTSTYVDCDDEDIMAVRDYGEENALK